MDLVSNRIHAIHHRAIKMQLATISTADNIVVCVQRHTRAFNVMKILMNVQSFRLSVEMVAHVLMKSVRTDATVRRVGQVRLVRKQSIIVFLSRAIVMARA